MKLRFTPPVVTFELMSDSYKLSHEQQCPPGTTGIYSYLESRGGVFPATLFFGLQYYLFDLKNKPSNCYIGDTIPDHLETLNSTKIRSTWTADDGTKPTPSGLFRPRTSATPAPTPALKV